MHRILIVLLLITGLLSLYYISKNKSLVKKIDSLKNEILILENKNALCKAYLEKQNLAIEKLKLDIKQKAPPKSIEKIKKSRLKMRVVKKNLGLIGLCLIMLIKRFKTGTYLNKSFLTRSLITTKVARFVGLKTIYLTRLNFENLVKKLNFKTFLKL